MKKLVKRLLGVMALSMAMILTGSELNLYVVGQNQGTMPVWVVNNHVANELAFDQEHSALTKESKDKILCDIFVVPMLSSNGVDFGDIMSLGDLLIFLGEAGACLAQIGLFCVPFLLLWKFILWLQDMYEFEIRLR